MNKIILKIIDSIQYKLSKPYADLDLDFCTQIRNKKILSDDDNIFHSVDECQTDKSLDRKNFYIFPFFYFHEESSTDYNKWSNEVNKFIETNCNLLREKNTCLCICDLYESSKLLKSTAETIQKKFPDINIWVITADKKMISNYVKIIYNDTWIKKFDPFDKILTYTPKKLYINLTRVSRYHRCLLIDNLEKNNLLSAGYNSWGDVYGAFLQYKELHPNTKIDKIKFDVLDIDDLSKVNPNRTVPIEHCNHSFLYLSTETSINSGYMFFSEKIYKPIGIGMPFITLGNPGTLRDLRDRGFITFGDWFDETYDYDLPIDKRIEIIIDNLKKYSKYLKKDLVKIRLEMQEICDHNLNVYKVLKRKNFLKENLQIAAKDLYNEY